MLRKKFLKTPRAFLARAYPKRMRPFDFLGCAIGLPNHDNGFLARNRAQIGFGTWHFD